MSRYSDPTANMAISNVMKELQRKEREAARRKRRGIAHQAPEGGADASPARQPQLRAA